MTTFADIQKKAEALSQTRDALSSHLQSLQVEIDAAKVAAMPDIKVLARKVAKQHTELQDLIKANPLMFVKPRTFVVDGIKFGLQKKVGTLDWDDDTKLCKRIRLLQTQGDLTEEELGLLIVTTDKPVAKALEKLDGKKLKRLGITLGSDTDETVIKSVDSEVEKAVNAVIKDVTKDANAEVAA